MRHSEATLVKVEGKWTSVEHAAVTAVKRKVDVGLTDDPDVYYDDSYLLAEEED